MLKTTAARTWTQIPLDTVAAAFEKHYERLLGLCFLLTRKPELAEDLAQEVFVKVLPKINTLDPKGLAAYLNRTAVNLWTRRRYRIALEARAMMRLGRSERTLDPGVEERDEVWRAVMRLPQRQRSCLVLRYYEDLSEEETARMLRCSIGTVKSSVSRALATLRKELQEAGANSR
jgi:RNA polymerase sigma-70 factor (sigma-E family)